MKDFFKWAEGVDWIHLGISLGLGLFILITFVRCALG